MSGGKVPLSIASILLLRFGLCIADSLWGDHSTPLAQAADPPGTSQSSNRTLPSGYQSYSDRPDIRAVTPQAHSDLAPSWPALRQAHVEAVAQLLELYPNQDLYFLARDSELLYDAARLIARHEPQVLSRLHLLNVSRANMRDTHLRDYLAQEGISIESLQQGRRPVFVDTGFSGTIPRVIGELFSSSLQSHLQTHLMCSTTSHPSSRVFLQALNPAVVRSSPGTMHGTILSYEQLPRFTDRSDRLVQVNGRWQAASLLGHQSDGSVNAVAARRYQEDLAHFIAMPETRTLAQSRRQHWRAWRERITRSGGRAPLVAELRQTFQSAQTQSVRPQIWLESAARDLIDWTETNGRAQLPTGHLPVQVSELGLPEVQHTEGSNKNALIQLFPQWAAILEDPVAQIPLLIQQRNTQTLAAILDVIQDEEFFRIAATEMGRHFDRSDVRQHVRTLIENANQETLRTLITTAFYELYTAQHPEFQRMVIERADHQTLEEVANYFFSEPASVQHPDNLRMVIERADQNALRALALNAFCHPHMAQHPDLLRMVIEKADHQTLSALNSYVFSQAHWKTPAFAPLREATRIQDPTARHAFLVSHLDPPTPTDARRPPPTSPTASVAGASARASPGCKLQQVRRDLRAH